MKSPSLKECIFTLSSNTSNQNVLSNFRDEAREQTPSFFMCFCFRHFMQKRPKNASEPHFATEPMNLRAGMCHWTERSLCTTVCCLYAFVCIYSLFVFLYQGALNPSEILHGTVVPAVNTSTCMRQTTSLHRAHH